MRGVLQTWPIGGVSAAVLLLVACQPLSPASSHGPGQRLNASYALREVAPPRPTLMHKVLVGKAPATGRNVTRVPPKPAATLKITKPSKAAKVKTVAAIRSVKSKASTSRVQSPQPKARITQPPPALWHTRANEALQTTVRRFARQAGYQLIANNAGNKWRLMFAASHQGDFRSALNWLAAGFAEARPRPRFVLYANQVLKLEAAP